MDRNILAQWVTLALFGLIFLASGVWIVLMATHVFMAAAGMLFVGAGLWLLTLPLTGADRQGIVGGVLALSFITFLGVFLTWVALTGPPGRASVSLGGLGLLLPPPVAAILSRGFAGVLALVFDAIALVAWPVMLFSLWREATASRKPGAP